jgi:hypothetical protein
MKERKLRHFLTCSKKVADVCDQYGVKVLFWIPNSSSRLGPEPYIHLEKLEEISSLEELEDASIDITSNRKFLWEIWAEEEILECENFCEKFESRLLSKIFS